VEYTVILHSAEEGGYWVEVPALLGCFSQGETVDEALRNIKEAIELHIECLEQEKMKIPKDEGFVLSMKDKTLKESNQRLLTKRVNAIVKLLVEWYKPEKIILFGSAISGYLNKDSDIDLLIIKRTKKNPWERSLEVDRMIDRDFPVDLLVYTPSEIQKRLKIKDFFIQEIIEKGRVVYEKTNRKDSKRMAEKGR
jgi:predicted RNase H-like HicB family nuclease/predicted nucleotidyltransferase